ncbi:MAG: transcription termination factor Rho [Lachnospiraceae bacterium]|nr:transcription termination factor Rho [Lachnospiraceae bacterium]MCI5588758.1 transcription termination factor Rho [Lachnospiraceae bacterium]
MSDYENMSLVDLRLEAKKLGIKNVTTYKKKELLEKIKEFGKNDNAAQVKKTERKKTVSKNNDNKKINKKLDNDNKDVDIKNIDNKKNDDRNEDILRENNSYKTSSQDKKVVQEPDEISQLDSGEVREGILEVMQEGYGFIRCDNYLPGDGDVYVSPALIRKYHLRTGDILRGNVRIRNQNEKFGALLYIRTVNGVAPDKIINRVKFEQLTPIFPNERIRLETAESGISMRMMDLIAPIGKGQRGMIVSQPKTGKTTLLKQVAKSVKRNHPKMHLIVLLIDERPEEVTDIKESIMGHNVEVIYSTFDELPENHKRVSEMVIERAKRLVEHGEDVMILLDSITRLARAYNLTVQPSGRTLSGGLDPAALHMPKRFFGAARNMREGGSLTILATALVDTGSKMDDVVFEEFKGTGNMELVLDRRLSEKRVFPAIDLPKSSTRRDDLLLTQEEIEANYLIRKAFNGSHSDEAVEKIIDMFRKTKNNQEFIQMIKKVKIV